MNSYINLNRVEFIVTNACSGRCKHCSKGNNFINDGGLNVDVAVTALKRVAERFTVNSVMTFGGEPLLYAETVCKIHATARDCDIPKRQIITNGYFSKDSKRINEVAYKIFESGINDVLLSVDVFHQEFIPIEPIMQFAEYLLFYNIPSLRVHPAWVVNQVHDNHYNSETKRLLKLFTDKGIQANGGNNIFPSGNALKYLSEYFPPSGELDLSLPCGSAPYTAPLDDVDCIGINPNGDVSICSVIGNIYDEDILKIIDNYNPYNVPVLRSILDGGVSGLLRYAESQGVYTDISDCRSACGVCHKVLADFK